MGRFGSYSSLNRNQDFLFQVSDANIAGLSNVSIIGDNPAVGTSSEESVWAEGGMYVFPTSASTMTVSSSDANDDILGTGGRVINIEGLNSDWEEISELVVLDGQTAVTTTNSFFRINAMTVVSSGTSLKNEGIIYIGTGTVTSGKPANVYGLVSIGEGISHTAVYSVPANKEFFLIRGAFGSDSGKQINAFMDAQPTVIGRTLVRGTTYSIDGQEIEINFEPSEPYTEKTDVYVTCIATSGGGAGEFRVNLAGILKG